MKKFLLSLAAIAICGSSAFAADYELTMKGSSYEFSDGTKGTLGTTTITAPGKATSFTVTTQGFTLKALKNDGSNCPTYNKAEDVRLYAKNTLTITPPAGEKITSIEFVMSSQGKSQQGTITADPGTVTQNKTDNSIVSWAGDAENVTFTVGGNNDFGTNTSKTAGQLCFASVKISTVAASGPVKENPELKFEPNTLDIVFGDKYASPVFSSKVDKSLVTFTSTNPKVAVYSAQYGLELMGGFGETEITATFAENDEFYGGTATLTVNVTNPNAISVTTDDFTFENPADLAVWSIDTKYECLKGSAYKGGVKEAVAYAVSPVYDLTGKKSATLEFQNAFNQYKLNNVIIEPADFPGKYAFIVAREEGATEWTLVAEPKAPEAFSWDFYDNGTVDLSAFAGKKMQFAFKYVSTAEVAGTWEVKNVTLTSVDKDPVFAPEAPEVKIAGQTPAGDVEIEEGSSVEVSFDAIEGAQIYYNFTATATENFSLRAEGYTLYDAPFTISEAGKLSYYAENEGGQSEIKTLNFTVKAKEPAQELPEGIEISPAPGKVTEFPKEITIKFTKLTGMQVFIQGGYMKIVAPNGNITNVNAPSSMEMSAPQATGIFKSYDASQFTESGKYTVVIPKSIFYFMTGGASYPTEITFFYDLQKSTGVDGVEAEEAAFDVYDLNGRLVRRQAADLNGLDKGIYIVNGKKVLVK